MEKGLNPQFGTSSQYGERLQYGASPVYRDIVFAIAYYLHLAAVIGVCAYLWVSEYPNLENDSTNNNNNNNNEDWQDVISSDLTGIFVGISVCALCGIVFGIFWLSVMKRFASTIIKTMLWVNIGCWVVVAIVGIAYRELALAVIGVIIALFNALYAWCIWRRIAFSSALLSVASAIISTFHGTMWISLLVIVFNVIYVFLWGSTASVYYMVTDENNTSGFVIFLLLVAFYWAFQVHQNISHTTTAGVTAAWFFSSAHNFNATMPALKRTMTTSFGSVCFGSLLVAFLQALRAMVRAAQNERNQWLSCIALCLLNCIESLIRFFNKYAYCHCAIYGESFITAAKQTMELFAHRGFMAIINDDLSSLPIVLGSLIGGALSGGIGYGIGYAFYGSNANHDIKEGAPIALAVYGFLIGLMLCGTILYVVHSAVVCLFVCYCEDPAALSNNRPEEYQRIVQARPDFASINVDGNQAPPQQQRQDGHNEGNMYGSQDNGGYRV
eukprot:CAMPEP_0202694770 /NCGR_PEP_ID=MMETSP1385-20130828/8541_1 /ASSEMBLY_ACC=CAM_ASM_000861 /TAXON_ID=933848 /ORGANISM="Elphidium margaritaceum" /LENGTH=497 /DNA_ID=CAMNT_0049350673 /DNA_START=770 /DNA_END=2263 /DNA_ORIENTATION=-